jgi:hypothetical protein
MTNGAYFNICETANDIAKTASELELDLQRRNQHEAARRCAVQLRKQLRQLEELLEQEAEFSFSEACRGVS